LSVATSRYLAFRRNLQNTILVIRFRVWLRIAPVVRPRIGVQATALTVCSLAKSPSMSHTTLSMTFITTCYCSLYLSILGKLLLYIYSIKIVHLCTSYLYPLMAHLQVRCFTY